MGIKSQRECGHCKRFADDLYDIGFDHSGGFLLVGRGCDDCVQILKEKLDAMAKQIQSAKLN